MGGNGGAKKMYKNTIMCYSTSTIENIQVTGSNGPANIVQDRHSVTVQPYFVLSILQLVLMIVFNDGCMITVAYDNVKDSQIPKKWALPELYILASTIAFVVVGEQFLLLYFGMGALQAQTSNLNIFEKIFGIEQRLQASELQAMMYASLSWAGFLTLLAARTEGYFFERRPGNMLSGAAFLSFIVSMLFSVYLRSAKIDFFGAPWVYIAVAMLYNVIAFILLDIVKVFCNKLLVRHFHGAELAAIARTEIQDQNRRTLVTEDYNAGKKPGSTYIQPNTNGQLQQEDTARGSIRQRVTKLTQLAARLTKLQDDAEAKSLMQELREMS